MNLFIKHTYAINTDLLLLIVWIKYDLMNIKPYMDAVYCTVRKQRARSC